MKTPLHEAHLRLGAKMTEFGGWDMPLYYTSIVKEVTAVRSSAGIFDLSHMGEIYISGPSAIDLIQYVCTNDASKLEIGQAQYSLLCNESGGVLDDLVVYRLDAELYMLVVNASNATEDLAWILSKNSLGAIVEDRSADTALIAIQGPKSAEILKQVTDADLGMKRFRIQQGIVADVSCLIASTGYTGDAGFELYCSANDAQHIWDKLSESQETTPIGLGARDVLRVEAGYPLYGHELTTETTPVEAKLMWVVKPSKGDFIGRQAIVNKTESGSDTLLVGFIGVDRCIPRHGYELLSNDTPVGCVTSGTFSPTLEKGIGMAYVQKSFAKEGTELSLKIRDKACPCKVASLPFYRPL